MLRDQLRVLGADHPDTLMTRYQLIQWNAGPASSDQLRAALNDLVEAARLASEDKHHVALHAQTQLLWLRHNVGEDVKEELESLLTAASDIGGGDELTLTLRTTLLTVKIKRGDREAIGQLRRLLPEVASRLGNSHNLTRQIRENLSH